MNTETGKRIAQERASCDDPFSGNNSIVNGMEMTDSRTHPEAGEFQDMRAVAVPLTYCERGDRVSYYHGCK